MQKRKIPNVPKEDRTQLHEGVERKPKSDTTSKPNSTRQMIIDLWNNHCADTSKTKFIFAGETTYNDRENMLPILKEELPKEMEGGTPDWGTVSYGDYTGSLLPLNNASVKNLKWSERHKYGYICIYEGKITYSRPNKIWSLLGSVRVCIHKFRVLHYGTRYFLLSFDEANDLVKSYNAGQAAYDEVQLEKMLNQYKK